MENRHQNVDTGKKLLLKYAGLGSQIIVALGLAVMAGFYLDQWINIGFPLFVWAAPVCALLGILIKIVKDTSKNK